MANEITYTASLSASKSGAVINSGTLSDTVSMTGGDVLATTQNIGTSNEQIDMSSITGDCRIIIKNLSTGTDSVQIFKDNADAHLLSKLGAGEHCLLTQVPSGSLYAKATAALDIMIWACEV